MTIRESSRGTVGQDRHPGRQHVPAPRPQWQDRAGVPAFIDGQFEVTRTAVRGRRHRQVTFSCASGNSHGLTVEKSRSDRGNSASIQRRQPINRVRRRRGNRLTGTAVAGTVAPDVATDENLPPHSSARQSVHEPPAMYGTSTLIGGQRGIFARRRSAGRSRTRRRARARRAPFFPTPLVRPSSHRLQHRRPIQMNRGSKCPGPRRQSD